MDAHAFLDALVELIAPVLPAGFSVAVSHDFEAGIAYDRASEESMNALFSDPANSNGGGVITHQMHIVQGDSSLEALPSFVRRMMEAGSPTPELEFTSPDGGGSGTFLRGYVLDRDLPAPQQDASAPEVKPRALLQASIHALDDLQDFLCEELREPWPRSGYAEVPPPSGRVASGQILLRYGDEGDPVLAFPPMELGQSVDVEALRHGD